MAKIADIKSIIATVTNQTSQSAQGISYTAKAENKINEVHDVQPLTKPAYDATPSKLPISHVGDAQVVDLASDHNSLPNKSAVDKFVRTLSVGTDLVNIPGISKPILSKIGAIKIIKFFGLRTSVNLVDRNVDVDKAYISYCVKISAITRDGEKLYEVIGACNNYEAKFKKMGMSAEPTISQMAQKRAIVNLGMWLLAR